LFGFIILERVLVEEKNRGLFSVDAIGISFLKKMFSTREQPLAGPFIQLHK